MSVLREDSMKKLDIFYPVGEGATSKSFRCKNGMLLKKYKLNDKYANLLEYHDNKFLEYLLELIEYDRSDIICTPNDIYVGGSKSKPLVMGVSRDFEYGQIMSELYPKTDMIKLLNAIKRFIECVRELDDIELKDMHYENIIYTGDVKILDFDYCKFNNKVKKETNILRVNDGILRGLFHIDFNMEYYIRNDKLRSIFNDTKEGYVGIDEFLYEYIDLLEREYGKVKYYRHLTDDYLVKKLCK